ncbi:hypothetical protein I3842_01G134200 [Carya illinoinensis]|uniref:Uncharacterized protein n=1 Tax=Carya illinoinensis TaxID=32201 RepID=A0A922G3D1_CARIL|nr:hypothetical protein I3842_01G134200 [Carya illinoinensis]KAG6731553.1 hypothetical protein I3842_01G134200 [Carya illinoinensis]
MSLTYTETYTDAEIDILALAIHTNLPNEVNTNHGKALIQEIYLIDPSLKLLHLTIWNRFVHDECHEISTLFWQSPLFFEHGSKFLLIMACHCHQDERVFLPLSLFFHLQFT